MGKCPFFVAEELVLGQRAGQGGTVHRDQWLVFAWRIVVNETGCGFLAGSVFSIDQNRFFSAGKFLQQLSDMPDRYRLTFKGKFVITGGSCLRGLRLKLRHTPKVTENGIESVGL